VEVAAFFGVHGSAAGTSRVRASGAQIGKSAKISGILALRPDARRCQREQETMAAASKTILDRVFILDYPIRVNGLI
jgi:hypothetical protein